MRKVVAARSVLSRDKSPTDREIDISLAFELGIASYLYDCLIADSRAARTAGVAAIDDFLRWHARRAYGVDADWVCRRWREWRAENALPVARKCGETAAREPTSPDGMHRPGERAAALLRRALGTE